MNQIERSTNDSLPRKLAAILYADVAGYSRLTGEDEDATHRLLRDFLNLIAATVEKHNGQVMHYAGDAVLAQFSAVVDALSSAVAIQTKLAERNRNLPDTRKVLFRIGVNLGDVIEDRGDIYGDGVNVAARLEGLAEPGGICISESVHTTVGNKLSITYEDIGDQDVKNIAKPVRAYLIDVAQSGRKEQNEKPKRIAASSIVPDAVSLDMPARPSIAVLPFANMSGDPEQEYFSDGITEDILTALSHIRQFAVVARNTSFTYKRKAVDVQTVARELGVRYVLEGSVRKAGNRVRITAQLIDGESGNHIWAERYDRELEDIFAVQDEITVTIVGRIEPEIGASERQKVARKPEKNLHAWDCYHLGVAHFYKFTGEDNLEAQRLLSRSRELDPGFGEAHAWWAYATILGMVYWDVDAEQSLLDEALAAVQRALKIDDQNAVFYALAARVHLARGEYTAAIADNEMAVKLNPSFAVAYCSLGDSLAYEGRYEDAIEYFEKAIALSPNDPQRWAFLTYGALALIFNREFDKALAWAGRASVVPNCQYWTTAHMAVALAHLDRLDEARQTIARLIVQKPEFTRDFVKRKLFYLKRPEQLEIYLDGLRKAGLAET